MNKRRRYKAKAKRAERVANRELFYAGLLTLHVTDGGVTARYATDEEAREAGERMVVKHRKLLEALAAHDRGEGP